MAFREKKFKIVSLYKIAFQTLENKHFATLIVDRHIIALGFFADIVFKSMERNR